MSDHSPHCNDVTAAPAAPDAQPVAWADAERIRDLPAVDEAIRALLKDNTGDNATAMVQAVLEAAAPVAQQPEDWRLKASAWLTAKAEHQEQVNREYPQHVACYPSWEMAARQYRWDAEAVLKADPSAARPQQPAQFPSFDESKPEKLAADPYDLECPHCHDDGMDPMSDHLLPCPVCQGEQKP